MMRRSGAAFGFVFLVALLTVAGWSLSAFKLLRYEWLALLPGITGALWIACRTAGSWTELRRQLGESLAFWPTLLLGGIILVSAASYPPTMLDSLVYRLPRMLLWNQFGEVHYIPTAEDRLNYLSHVWCLCTLPVVQLGGIRLAWVWNFVSWVICLEIFHCWATPLCDTPRKARQLSFLAGSSTFAVLQASSTANDLLAATLILASLYFIVLYEAKPASGLIGWALVSLSLAAGVKANFTTLGLPFVLWFFLARSRPWKVFHWQWAPLLALLLLLCSPLPSFLINLKHFGSIAGMVNDKTFCGHGPLTNDLFAAIMLFWQNLQPCVNPLGLVLDKPLAAAVAHSGINELAPRFNLRMGPVSMVDGASLGLLTAALIATGMVLGLRRNPKVAKSWPIWALAGGMLALFIAAGKVLPAAIGRSSAGFLYLAFPLALVGWATCSARHLRMATLLSLSGCVIALVMTPERPLWPVGWVRATAERLGHPAIAHNLQIYQQVAERRKAGSDLMDAVPASETRLVALVADDHPLLTLLWPPRHFQVELLDDDTTLDSFKKLNTTTVLTSGAANHSFPEICRYLEQSGDYERVLTHDYISKLTLGPETWSLYRRKVPAPKQPDQAPSPTRPQTAVTLK